MTKDIELDLHFTNLCNLACSHCLYSSGDDIGEVPVEVLNDMIKQFATIGVNTVHIGGGEPLTRYKDLLSFVQSASSSGVRPRLITNGMLLNENKMAELIDHGLEELLVSLDGTEETHNAFRLNNKAYQGAVNAIRLGLDNGVFTRVNSVLTSKNKDNLKDLLKFTTQLPVAVHAFLCLSPMGRGNDIRDLVPSFEYVGKFIEEVSEICAEYNFPDTKIQIQKGFLEPEVDDAHHHCRINNRNNALIYSTGNVFPCVRFSNYGTDYHNEFSLGNINDESISDIWSNDNHRWRLFERNLNRDSGCEDKSCQGGCRGLMLSEKDDISACDYRCTYKTSGKLPSCIRKYAIINDPSA